MKIRKKLLIPFLVAAALLIAGGIFCYRYLRFPCYTSAACTESAKELRNPYIGWYQIYPYSLSDTDPLCPPLVPEQESGPGLVLLEINLHNYAQTPVSETGLAQLKDILDAWHSTDRQLIVRFLYDWDGLALEKEPESLSLVLEHMSQTAEIINLHSDCVYILQGIYVGAWGEMHSSRYMGEEDMLILINHLAAVTSPDIFLAVRTPGQWRTITGSPDPLPPENAFDGSLAARLGLFNDGMLGSDTDMGTYAESGASFSPAGLEKRSREAEHLFQEALCRYVPNGGEVIIANPYNDLSPAIQDLARTHVSYLNGAYDEDVLSKWRETVWGEEGIFQGMSGYDHISRRLGYRYVLRSSAFAFTVPWETEALLTLTLENVGFSNAYRAFDVSLIAENTGNGRKFTFPVRTDTRFWNAQFQLDIPLEIRELTAGAYDLYLQIQDPASGCAVRLANEEADYDNGCFVGTLTLQSLPQWDFLFGALIGKAQDMAVGSPPQQ